MIIWEDTQEGTGIMLDSRTVHRLNDGRHSPDKGWKVLRPEEVESGDVISVWIVE